MKLKILKDDDHWITPARCKAFKKGTEVNVPQEIGEALLAKEGVAEKVAGTQSTTKAKSED